MKFSNRIKLSLRILTILLTSITSLHANSNAPITAVDDIINQAQKLLSETRRKASELSAMINNGQINSIKSKNDATENIKQFVDLIQTIQHERFVHVGPSTALLLLQINQDLVKHIEQCLENGFPTFQKFEIALVTKRKQPTEKITFELLEKEIKKNKQVLKVLNGHIDHAGLKWQNLAYRKLDKYIIDPALKYSIPSRTFEIGALASLGLLFWWIYNNDSFKKNMPTKIYDLFGERPQLEKTSSGMPENHDQLGPIGKVMSILASKDHGYLPIFAGASILTYKAFMREWKYYKPKIVNKLSIMHNRLKGGAFANRANQLDETFIQDVSFDDIIGLEHVKEKFKLLVEYLKNPEPYDRLGLTPQKGCLLVGESRTGKTFSVKALANEIKKLFKNKNDKDAEFKYLEFNASEINQNGIQYLLSLVKEVAPCVVFIDEIDLLDLQRRGKNQTLSEFLTCMSGTLESKDPKNQVIIIAATNKPESLDTALRQAGRFGLELRFEYPSLKDRKTLFERKLDKLSLNPKYFDLDKLAQETEGQSYEALGMLIDQAVLRARIHGEILSQEHLQKTLNAEIRRIMPANNKEIPEYEKNLLATHFAGHSLALTLLDTKKKLSIVTIKPVMTKIKEELIGTHLLQKEESQQERYEYGQVFTNHAHDTINVLTRQEQIKLCQYHLAGIVAEEMFFGTASYCCHKADMMEALKIAQSITFEGFEVNKLPKHLQKERHDKALALIEQCKKEVRQLLEQHKDVLANLITELKEKETLTAREIYTLVNPAEHEIDLEKDAQETVAKENNEFVVDQELPTTAVA